MGRLVEPSSEDYFLESDAGVPRLADGHSQSGLPSPLNHDDTEMVVDLTSAVPRLSWETGIQVRRGYEFSKRFFDLIVSTLFCVLLSPVLALIAIAVKVTSRGPVFFWQERVGRYGEHFLLLKYRTMVDGADDQPYRDHYAQLANGERRGLLIENDPRITNVGRFLRKWSLDELPNLWNVLKGEMALVGPRPLVPYELKLHDRGWLRRLEVQPGVTGLAQIGERHEMGLDERANRDLAYVDHRSFWYDLRILAKTVPSIARSPGP